MYQIAVIECRHVGTVHWKAGRGNGFPTQGSAMPDVITHKPCLTGADRGTPQR